MSMTAVNRRFSSAASGYHHYAEAQQQLAVKVCQLLPSTLRGPLLEAGCGTGLLTRLIASRHPECSIDALDFSDNMLLQCRQQLDNTERVRFILSDIMQFHPPQQYTAIVSSSALHWLPSMTDLMNHLSNLLSDGGIMAIGMMTRGTLRELHEARHAVARIQPYGTLPDRQSILAAVDSARLAITSSETIPLTIGYRDAHHFLKSIHRQGVTAGAVSRGKRLLNRQELTALKTYYDRHYRCRDGVYATYETLTLLLEKRL